MEIMILSWWWREHEKVIYLKTMVIIIIIISIQWDITNTHTPNTKYTNIYWSARRKKKNFLFFPQKNHPKKNCCCYSRTHTHTHTRRHTPEDNLLNSIFWPEKKCQKNFHFFWQSSSSSFFHIWMMIIRILHVFVTHTHRDWQCVHCFFFSLLQKKQQDFFHLRVCVCVATWPPHHKQTHTHAKYRIIIIRILKNDLRHNSYWKFC